MLLHDHAGASDGSEADDPLAAARGLANALLIAIPCWAAALVAFSLWRSGEVGEGVRLALLFGAAWEAKLLRPRLSGWWRALRGALERLDAGTRAPSRGLPPAPARHLLGDLNSLHSDLEKLAGQRIRSIEELLRYVEAGSRPQPTLHRARIRRAARSWSPVLRQSLALSALVGAYLQYYFLDVNLQIATLNSMIVFLPVGLVT